MAEEALVLAGWSLAFPEGRIGDHGFNSIIYVGVDFDSIHHFSSPRVIDLLHLKITFKANLFPGYRSESRHTSALAGCLKIKIAVAQARWSGIVDDYAAS